MIKLVYLWNLKPDVDPEEFETYYYNVHVALTKRIPGQKRYVISKVRPSQRRQVPFYRMAENWYESTDAFKAAMASPEAKAAIEDHGFDARVKDMITVIVEEEEVPLQEQA